MNRVNANDLPWEERTSPKGTYRRFRRTLARALEAPAAGPALPGRAPFEVELVRVPAGATGFLFHAHAAEWECYLILSGTGTMRHGEQRSPLVPGDCVLCPPGDAHQIVNDGEADLVYYVVANNAPVEIWQYPDSGKWGFTLPAGGAVFFRKTDAPYFDDDE